MSQVRAAAVAGTFYPKERRVLTDQIQAFINSANIQGPMPKAIICPHAGYIYSGPIAAYAYKLITQGKEQIKKVVLLGPAHRVPFKGIALSSADSFSTPLGKIPLDKSSLQSIAELPQVSYLDDAHTLEHSLEVQLPFLQMCLNEFSLVPALVGDANPQEVAEVLEILWGDSETLIVISSDLSHYQDYRTAQQRDEQTSLAIQSKNFQDINYEDACGCNPINGLLWLAKKQNLQIDILEQRNSGDTAGSRDRVVGYGAYAIH